MRNAILETATLVCVMWRAPIHRKGETTVKLEFEEEPTFIRSSKRRRGFRV
jgi:hypothetical protein